MSQQVLDALIDGAILVGLGSSVLFLLMLVIAEAVRRGMEPTTRLLYYLERNQMLAMELDEERRKKESKP